mmetsp:Transcript_22186/g.53752  ORF Transcript_22186/g.53752 Transcript_22186/m.53752 type:complete len:127 (-) Transcript_22186:1113-1493(-)
MSRFAHVFQTNLSPEFRNLHKVATTMYTLNSLPEASQKQNPLVRAHGDEVLQVKVNKWCCHHLAIETIDHASMTRYERPKIFCPVRPLGSTSKETAEWRHETDVHCQNESMLYDVRHNNIFPEHAS